MISSSQNPVWYQNIYEIYCDFPFCLNEFIQVSSVPSALSAVWVLFFVWKREMLPSCERRVRVSGVSLTVVCRRMEKGVKVGKGGQVGRVGCLWQRGRAECHHDLPNQGPEPNRAKREKMRVLGGVGSELKGRRGCCQFLRNLLSLLSSPPSPILLPLEKWGQGVNVMQHAECSKWALWYSDRRICSTLLGS